MTLSEHIRSDFLAARIARDPRSGFYSVVVGEIEKIEKASGRPATDQEVTSILRKLRKAVDDTLAIPGLSADKAESYAREGRWINAYLPTLLSEEDLAREVPLAAGALGVAVEAKSTGAIMKALNEKFPGQVDGKLVSAIIRRGAA